MFQELRVDLRRAPKDRWRLTRAQMEQGRDLLMQYTADLGPNPETGEILISTAREFVPQEHWDEMESLADQVGSAGPMAWFRRSLFGCRAGEVCGNAQRGAECRAAATSHAGSAAFEDCVGARTDLQLPCDCLLC